MVEFSTEKMEQIKQAALDFKNQIASFFKDHSAEMKDWRFAIEGVEDGYLINASVQVLVKQKPKK